MGSRKRSRTIVLSGGASGIGVLAPRAAPRKRRKQTFQPGRDRVGGYYGRFSGAGAEFKFHDVDLDNNTVAAGGNMTDSINKIAQSVTESERIGRKCVIKSVQWKFDTFLPISDAAATPLDGDTIRVILYVDKQANGATAANTDILETNDYQSFRNLAQQSRFTILMDRQINMNYITLASDGAGVVSQGEVIRQGVFYKRCNVPIEFDNTSGDGAITTIRTNNIGVMLLGKNGRMGFQSKIRLRFSDG